MQRGECSASEELLEIRGQWVIRSAATLMDETGEHKGSPRPLLGNAGTRALILLLTLVSGVTLLRLRLPDIFGDFPGATSYLVVTFLLSYCSWVLLLSRNAQMSDNARKVHAVPLLLVLSAVGLLTVLLPFLFLLGADHVLDWLFGMVAAACLPMLLYTVWSLVLGALGPTAPDTTASSGKTSALPTSAICRHEGETSNYCTRCWARIKPGLD
jgi:hypothetical protein